MSESIIPSEGSAPHITGGEPTYNTETNNEAANEF